MISPLLSTLSTCKYIYTIYYVCSLKKIPFEYSQEVTNDYEKLLETDEEYDVIIYAGENENVKEFHAHSLILRTRSQYFRKAFFKKWYEKENRKFIFKKPDISRSGNPPDQRCQMKLESG